MKGATCIQVLVIIISVFIVVIVIFEVYMCLICVYKLFAKLFANKWLSKTSKIVGDAIYGVFFFFLFCFSKIIK